MFPYHRSLGEVPLTPPAQKEQEFHTEPYAIPYSVILTSGQEIRGAGAVADNDGDFHLTALAGVQTGAYEFRLRLPSGRYWPFEYTRNSLVIGTGAFPVAVGNPIIFPSGARIPLDIHDLSGSSNTIQILFIGFKYFRTR